MSGSPAQQLDFQALFETASGLYLVMTPDFIIVNASDAYLRATMTRRKDITGKYLFDVFPDNPNDPNANSTRNLRASLERVLQSRSSDTMPIQKYDIPIPGSTNGRFEERYWSPVNSPVLNKVGKITHILHRVEDVTDFMRMRQPAGASGVASPAQGFLTRNITPISITAITVLALAIAFMFYWQAQMAEESRAWISHTHEVTKNIHMLSSTLDRATLEQRGYVITGDERYLAGYRDTLNEDKTGGKNELINAVNELQRLTADNPPQQRHVVELEGILGSILAYQAEAIRQRQQGESLPVWIATPQRSKELLDHAHQLIDAMTAMEDQLLAPRIGAYKIRIQENVALTFAVIGLLYISMILSIWLTLRNRRYARRMELEMFNRSQEIAEINRQLKEANREARGLLAGIVESSSDAILSMTLSGTITSWNVGAQRLFGYDAEEAIGQHITFLIPLPRQKEEQVIMAQIREGKLVEHFETVRIGKDGRQLNVSLSVSPIRNADGAIIGASKIARDITERKAAEEQLVRYTAELERSNQELDDFAYIASHDLKEPLRGLHNHAAFLLEDNEDKLDNDSVHRLKRLGYLTQRMEHLVNDLLYFSRLGRTSLAVEKIDPNAVIAEIRQMMEALIKERHAEIRVPVPLPSVICDRPRITEVFRNLITNAIKYNDKPEKIIEVGYIERMDAPQGPEKNIFYIKDNGIGIEQEFHQDIFKMFKRLNSRDDQETGTGVGLTFVRKIVERHKGHIWLESEPGKGSTFYFSLPSSTEL